MEKLNKKQYYAIQQYEKDFLQDLVNSEILSIYETSDHIEIKYFKDRQVKYITICFLPSYSSMLDRVASFEIRNYDLPLAKTNAKLQMQFEDTLFHQYQKTYTVKISKQFDNLYEITSVEVINFKDQHYYEEMIEIVGLSLNDTKARYLLKVNHFDNNLVFFSDDELLRDNEHKEYQEFEIFSKSTDILSQWYKCSFKDNKGFIYNSAEQYMMAKKALLFQGNDNTYRMIMKSDDMKTIKDLGRQIYPFNQIIWDKYKMQIVFEANYFKFNYNYSCNKKVYLVNHLLSTDDKYIVEANPNDMIWASGLKQNNNDITNISKHKGQNLLGKILMKVRDICKEDGDTTYGF